MKTIIDYLESHLGDTKHFVSMNPDSSDGRIYAEYALELDGYISGLKSMEQGVLNDIGRKKITVYLKNYLEDIQDKGHKGIEDLNFMTAGTQYFYSYEEMKNYFSELSEFINVFQDKEAA